ncbi:MAG: DUF262 domain-containing protein [Gammaproteobacteria bacterium]|nr:DUF262 domain-containing protein [Gammaproteobacteria bacterium]
MTDAAMTNTSPVSAVNPDSAAVHTSLAQLFSSAKIQAIEIPLIQRDYAQGRRSMQVDAIREQFLDSLCSALRKPDGIDLDFVFGDVVDGTLYPLDGQQRLTTLFLLHCYLAWHLPETIGIYQPWHAFHYATRPGARAFCRFLSQCRPDMAQGKLSHWLQDQATYLPTWEHDPTIQGMLVVLDDLHLRYRETPPEDLRSAWLRLIDPQQPAIRFYLLPIRANHLDNSLYVKMNSRGKPLTAFENFKAELEGLLRDSSHIPCDKVDNFSRKIDTEWVDLFWHYRGNNDLIDEEVTRYLRFLFEVLAWNHDVKVNHLSSNDAQELARLANELLGPGSKVGANVWIGSPRHWMSGWTLRWTGYASRALSSNSSSNFLHALAMQIPCHCEFSTFGISMNRRLVWICSEPAANSTVRVLGAWRTLYCFTAFYVG